MRAKLRIATRESALALWQAEHVAARLRATHPGIAVELVPMTTRGDQILDQPLAKIGGKGLFLKELELALLREQADLAVHSLKDVPMTLEAGFTLAAILERANPFDAFVSRRYASFDALPRGARVGTSSLRRQVQLRAMRPDLQLLDLRGNVNTRLAKLDSGQYDAIVLACAGLERLGLADRIVEVLAPPRLLPAVGQGAIAIETRAGDTALAQWLAPLIDAPTTLRVRAERAMNRRLGGSCDVPIAGFATLDGQRLSLSALVGDPDSGDLLRAEAQGSAHEPEALGLRVAEHLLARGAERILAARG